MKKTLHSFPLLQRRGILILFFLAGLAVSACAATWNESLQGDLSNNRLAPSSFVLDPGLNTLAGTVIGGGTPDRDYLTFSVLAGYVLQSLELEDYSSPTGLSFIGIQEGTTFTEPPTGTNVANLFGYAHFGESLENVNILPIIGEGDGAIGFLSPLPAGSYALWIQETGGSARSYNFSFNMAAVPEPGTVFLVAVGLAVFAASVIRNFLKPGARKLPDRTKSTGAPHLPR